MTDALPEGHPAPRQVVRRLDALAEALRVHLRTIDDPKYRALCETAAETLGGLTEAFSDYRDGEEPAWSGGD